MRPLSPATLEKLYRVSMREDLQKRADEVTATFDLGAMREAATTALGHTCNAIYHIAQGMHIIGSLTNIVSLICPF